MINVKKKRFSYIHAVHLSLFKNKFLPSLRHECGGCGFNPGSRFRRNLSRKFLDRLIPRRTTSVKFVPRFDLFWFELSHTHIHDSLLFYVSQPLKLISVSAPERMLIKRYGWTDEHTDGRTERKKDKLIYRSIA